MSRVDIGLSYSKVTFPAICDEVLPPLLVLFGEVDLSCVGNEEPSDECANESHRAADDERVSYA